MALPGRGSKVRCAGLWRICAGRVLVCGLAFVLRAASTAEAVCASVQLDIPQSVAMERQAFEAVLNLRNGLMHLDLEDVELTLRIRDLAGQVVPWTADPGDDSARFFVREESLEGIASLNGDGLVAAGASAEARWLLIPAPGAGGDAPGGIGYEVGARLAYTLAGTRYDLELAPDTIQVLPMPDLRLDLFVPQWVPGDDPRTPGAEPSVPVAVGLRVLNEGAGTAARVTLALGSPRIVDNATGLAVDFALSGCDVDGQPATPSPRASLGDLPPSSAGVVRWWLACSLVGTFVDVGVSATHADELGGAVTALIREGNVRAHRLRKDVRVDLPGRDARPDFLAVDGGLYESDGPEAVCADVSAGAGLTVDGDAVTVSLVSTGGFVYAGLRLPGERWAAGRVSVRSAARADGLRLAPANAWTEARRGDLGQWEAWVGVFDWAPPGGASYRVDLRTNALNRAPCFAPVVETRAVTGRELAVRLDAYDPDGTRPRISVAGLPVGASFEADDIDGGWLRWTPAEGQAGLYRMKASATDGDLTASLWVPVAVTDAAAARGALFFFR